MKKNISLALTAIIILFVVNSCGVYETVENVARIKFKVESYKNFRLADVPLEGRNWLKDFSTMEYVRLTGAFVKGKLPFSFIVNVEAKNPNDGTGGYPATDITVQSFPFSIYIKGKEVFTGNIEEPFNVPGIGDNVMVPVKVEFDLLKFFKEKGFEDVVDLAMGIGGKDGDRSKIEIKVQPVIGTPVGNIKYPDQITIDHNF